MFVVSVDGTEKGGTVKAITGARAGPVRDGAGWAPDTAVRLGLYSKCRFHWVWWWTANGV